MLLLNIELLDLADLSS